jgi:hypothetical protein
MAPEKGAIMEEQRIKIGTPASGQHHPAKPMLSIDEQINHLKSKDVTFRLCSEEEAAAYLTDRTSAAELRTTQKRKRDFDAFPRYLRRGPCAKVR